MRRLPPYDLLKRRLQADQTLDRIEAALDRVAVLVDAGNLDPYVLHGLQVVVDHPSLPFLGLRVERRFAGAEADSASET